jgi:lipopolysaccharide export system protein LptA
MKWQQTARFAIAAFVVVFALIVVLALRRNRTPEAPTTSPRTDEKAIAQTSGGLDFKRHTDDGKLAFALSGGAQVTYEDGRTRITGNPALTVPDRGGRTVKISGDQMDIETPPDKLAELKTAVIRRNVRLEASDGLIVTASPASEATYNEQDGILKVPGAVQFARGRMKGSGVGATYHRDRDELQLLSQARVTVGPDEKGQGAAEASADAATFSRGTHSTLLAGHARIVGDARTLDADDIQLWTTEDDKQIQRVEMRGSSRITGAQDGAGPQHMSADDIDLTYAPDGRSLERAKLMERAAVDLPAQGAAGRKVTARTIEIGMSPDGTSVTSLTATQNVVVELPAEGQAPARRIESAELTSTGAADAGLQHATFTGRVVYREMRAARDGAPAAERTARSDRLELKTEPGFGAIQQADFRGRVRFVETGQDRRTTAEAPRALYRIAEDGIDLSRAEGVPGPEPEVNDGRVSVKARTISMGLASRKLIAETDVRSSLQGRGGKPGSEAPGETGAKLPSMLKQDEPVLVTSTRLEYDGDASTALYTGTARMWQGQTSIEGDSILINDSTGNLTGQGKVQTVMFFDDTDPKTKVKTLARTTGNADTLVYEEDKRLATYTGKGQEQAHINGPQGDVTANVIRLFLKAGGNELERAEADDKVIVVEGHRRATGEHLTYTAADDTYVMKGQPVEVDEHTPPQCRKTRGATLTFQRSVDKVVVVGIPDVLPMVATPYACTAERRD